MHEPEQRAFVTLRFILRFRGATNDFHVHTRLKAYSSSIQQHTYILIHCIIKAENYVLKWNVVSRLSAAVTVSEANQLNYGRCFQPQRSAFLLGEQLASYLFVARIIFIVICHAININMPTENCFLFIYSFRKSLTELFSLPCSVLCPFIAF